MKKLIVSLLVFVFALSACSFTPPDTVTGSGKMVTQTFNVGDFDQIRLGTSGVMYIEQGNVFSLTVEADDNILPIMKVEVEKGVLTIRTSPEVSALQFETLIYRVTLPKLSAIDLSGSADIRVEDFSADSLNININGSGDVTFVQLEADSLAVCISGSGMMDVSGVTQALTVMVSGSGDLLAEKLKASNVDVAVNGSGDVTVWAVDTLDVSISGSGNVTYRGSPKLTEKISGGGDLAKLGN